MKKYHIMLNAFLVIIACASREAASLHGAAQKNITYKYQLRAEDGTVVKTNAPLHLDCGYVNRLFSEEWQRSYVEKQADGSTLIPVSLQAGVMLQMVQFLESDNKQKYIEDNKKDIYKLANFIGFFDISEGDRELVSYYKKNIKETVVLKEGLDSKINWSDEAKSGLGHIDALLRESKAFDVFLDIVLFRRAERPKRKNLVFYVWDTVEDVYTQVAAYTEEDIDDLKKMNVFINDSNSKQYPFKEGYLIDQVLKTYQDIEVWRAAFIRFISQPQ